MMGPLDEAGCRTYNESRLLKCPPLPPPRDTLVKEELGRSLACSPTRNMPALHEKMNNTHLASMNTKDRVVDTSC